MTKNLIVNANKTLKTMRKKDFSKIILVSITGVKEAHWRKKLKEIEAYKITEAALFLERFETPQRQKIYRGLLRLNIKKIPLVHIRNDMSRDELKFLVKHFNPKYLTIHEDSFNFLRKWRGYYKKLFLEMNYDNFISKIVKVKRIGGFCIDLSHFKAAKERNAKEYGYITEKIKSKKIAICNHLNGYSATKKIDLHTVRSLKDFDYLKTLPEALFGEKIAIECDNSIAEQLKFKDYLVKMLNALYRI
jgi:hypothetical protein